MADEAKGIAGAGKGFFTSEGVQKTREQLASDKPSKKEKSETKETDSVSTQLSEKTTDALGKVESRFVEKANKVIETVNSSQEDLKAARKVVNEQLAAAKDLKEAIKDKDTEKAAKARETLEKLQTKREELAKEIKSNNAERAADRVQNLNVGNDQKGIVKVGEVKFSSKTSESSDLDKVADVNKLIDSLKNDRESIRDQVQDLKEVKAQVKDTIKEVKAEISSIRKNTISSFQEAEKTANSIASQIRSGGIELVESTISKGLTPENVAQLIDQGA